MPRPLKNQDIESWLEPGRSLPQAGAGAPHHATRLLLSRCALAGGSAGASCLVSSYPPPLSPCYADTPTAATGIGPARALISFAARLRFTVITFSSTCTVTLASPQ